MTENASITARGLKKVYGRRPVLDQLDFTVSHGAAIGLLGANGTGKTTLLKCLLGLLPVDAGRCELLGEPSRLLSPTARGRIGYYPRPRDSFHGSVAEPCFDMSQRSIRYSTGLMPQSSRRAGSSLCARRLVCCPRVNNSAFRSSAHSRPAQTC